MISRDPALANIANSISSINDSIGLVLVKTQTIGSAVSSVTVTNAFSSTYDSYKIIINGGVGSAQNVVTLSLGASSTGYYGGVAGTNYSSGTVSGRQNNNSSNFLRAGAMNTNAICFNAELTNPFLAKHTYMTSMFVYNDESGQYTGYHAVSTSYSDFTLTGNGGTMTGGTIRVYGYRN
jgi:hypothetical protein